MALECVEKDVVGAGQHRALSRAALRKTLVILRFGISIFNRKAADDLGWGEQAVGKTMTDTTNPDRRVTIVGVLNDFHHKSLKLAINPVVMFLVPQRFGFVSIRIRPQNVAATLEYLRGIWKELYPKDSFAYYFMDEDFRSKYQAEDRAQQIYFCFGFIAIIVAGMSLYGLASCIIQQRAREIGIRKVLGARIHSIVLMLSREFVLWVLIANVLAWPAAYYVMNNWLRQFAYRIHIGIGAFLVSGVIGVLVALVTESFMSFKASMMNPVNTIRYE